MSCGFGAVVLLFMITKHSTAIPVEAPRYDFSTEVAQLQREIGEAEAAIAELHGQQQSRAGEIAAAKQGVAESRQALQEELARAAPAAGGGSRDIEALRASVRKLEADKQRLQAQMHERSRYVRTFVGEGNREYLTGVQLGGHRILILLDASASMLDETIVNVIRRRNMDEQTQRRSRKWQQALATVDWISARFPPTSSYQIYTYNTTAAPVLAGTDGRWLAVGDIDQLNEAVGRTQQLLPSGGTSLERAILVMEQMNPRPDNVYLITDSLPTQGLEPPRGTTVSGEARKRLFEAAVTRIPHGIPINVILLPMEGDPMAPTAYWQIARVTQGSFLSPAEDWP